MSNPKVSICIPYHDMKNAEFFLKRNIDSVMSQTFTDYEIVLTKDGDIAHNTNAGIKRARGEFIKILYLDDYFSYTNSLKEMLMYFEYMMSFEYMKSAKWAVVGTNNNIKPQWTDDIETGNNKLGSPSALIFKNEFENNLLFDEKMSWLLDCDLYKRMYQKYGKPQEIYGNFITIGEHDGQMTHILTDEEKLSEHEYIKQKYE